SSAALRFAASCCIAASTCCCTRASVSLPCFACSAAEVAAVAPAAPTSASPQPASSNASASGMSTLSMLPRVIGDAPLWRRSAFRRLLRNWRRFAFRRCPAALKRRREAIYAFAPQAQRNGARFVTRCLWPALGGRQYAAAAPGPDMQEASGGARAKTGVSMAKASMTNKIPAAQPRVRRGYFECRYGQLHVHNAIPPGGGFEEGTSLLCLHRTPLSGRLFGRFLALAGRDRSVYAPDTPGFGDSDGPSARPTIADYAGAIGD